MNDSGQDHIQSTDGCEVVYIASQFGRQKEMRLFRDKLEQIPGVKVNARWLDEEPLGREPTDRELVCMSSRDLNDVKMAATFILVNPPPYVGGRKELARGGRVYEAGVAGAIQMFVRDIVLVAIGDNECIHLAPGRWSKFDTIEQFLTEVYEQHRSQRREREVQSASNAN